MKDEILTGELARLCGVSADTIRHYERVGVIPLLEDGLRGHAVTRLRGTRAINHRATAQPRNRKDEHR